MKWIIPENSLRLAPVSLVEVSNKKKYPLKKSQLGIAICFLLVGKVTHTYIYIYYDYIYIYYYYIYIILYVYIYIYYYYYYYYYHHYYYYILCIILYTHIKYILLDIDIYTFKQNIYLFVFPITQFLTINETCNGRFFFSTTLRADHHKNQELGRWQINNQTDLQCEAPKIAKLVYKPQ